MITRTTSIAALIVVASCSPGHGSGSPGTPTETFRQTSDDALQAMETVFYQDGNWELCVPTQCGILKYDDFDWGADSLTAALYLRWSIDGDSDIPPMMTRLDANGATYGTCTASSCPTWSDVPLWDSIAASHEHLVLGSRQHPPEGAAGLRLRRRRHAVRARRVPRHRLPATRRRHQPAEDAGVRLELHQGGAPPLPDHR